MILESGFAYTVASVVTTDDSTYTRMTKHSIRSEALEYGIENKKLQ